MVWINGEYVNWPYLMASMWQLSSQMYDRAAISWIGKRSSRSYTTPVLNHPARITSHSTPVLNHPARITSHSTPALNHPARITSHSTPALNHSARTASHSTPVLLLQEVLTHEAMLVRHMLCVPITITSRYCSTLYECGITECCLCHDAMWFLYWRKCGKQETTGCNVWPHRFRGRKRFCRFRGWQKTNEWVPNKARVKRELLDTVKARKLA